MGDSFLIHEGNRRLQDRFESRRIADKLEFVRTAFSDDDISVIESPLYFSIATADADAPRDCSFEGGVPVFVGVTGSCELVFPDFKGGVHPRQPTAKG